MTGQTKQHDIARRYALAFFDLAKEQDRLELVSTDLQKLRLILSESADFRKFTNNTTLRRTDQAKVIAASGNKAKFNDLTQKFLGMLAIKRRLDILPSIISAVQEEIIHHKGEITAEVTAAYALNSKQMKNITAVLGKACGMTVKVKPKQDAAIIGGLVIKIGSRLIDNSVGAKLERLRRILKNSPEPIKETQT